MSDQKRMHIDLLQALKKMNEALELLDCYTQDTFDDTFNEVIINLENAIEPLSELWQSTY